MITLTVINQKGGVNKTTMALHFATAMAESGTKTLLIDTDYTQGSLSSYTLGPIEKRPREGLISMFLNSSIETSRIVHPTKTSNLDILQSEVIINGTNVHLEKHTSSDYDEKIKIKNFLDREEIKNKYQLVVIDTPASLGIGSINALTASDYAIIPTLATYDVFDSVRLIFDTISKIKTHLNNKLEVLGVVLTSTDKSEGITKHIREELENQIPKLLFKNEIRKNSKFKELLKDQSTIFDIVGKSNKSVIDYNDLSEEIMNRIREKLTQKRQQEQSMEASI